MFDLTLAIALLSLAIAIAGAFMSWNALKRSSYRTATDLLLEVDHVFIDKPELRPYFYSNEPAPAEEPERGRVEAVAEFYLDVLEAIWDHRGEFTKADRESWREWIHDVFESSPVLRGTYTGMEPWYPTLSGLFEGEPCTMGHAWATSKRTANAGGAPRWFRSRPTVG